MKVHSILRIRVSQLLLPRPLKGVPHMGLSIASPYTALQSPSDVLPSPPPPPSGDEVQRINKYIKYYQQILQVLTNYPVS
jgi:hypothetical protein